MPVHAGAAGTELEARVVDVTVRMLLAYAAGVGEVGARTFDDAREDFVAVPAFCASLEWPVLSSPARLDALGLAGDDVRRSVHAGQDSTFHRPVRPGDRLRTTGRIIALRQTRAGVLVATRLETSDARDGAPVTTTWHTSMYRGLRLEGAGSEVAVPPSIPSRRDAPARRAPVVVAPEMPHVYSECAGIWNPIHTERCVARAAGLADVLLHGTATWALAGREIVRAFCGGDHTRLRRLRARFSAPVAPGTSILVSMREPDADGHVWFDVLNPDGGAAVIDGLADVTPERA